jgi:hypothetical protein
MKTFSARADLETSARQTAWGCFTTNLVMPGAGSLAGGRKIGAVQLVLCLAGLAVTMLCGVHFIFWTFAHWSELHNPSPDADPLAALSGLWREVRWPLLGFALFALAWFWALFTSLALLSQTKKES